MASEVFSLQRQLSPALRLKLQVLADRDSQKSIAHQIGIDPSRVCAWYWGGAVANSEQTNNAIAVLCEITGVPLADAFAPLLVRPRGRQRPRCRRVMTPPEVKSC